ncbi:ABC transporter permease [Rhizobium johnstonii]|uniref:ABC transporter permease n=1 Tax=Rhizobium TaxID=379 RepID=UPI0010312224|nr:ABC transporter permease [Rhizobium leguminosarum]TBF70839.1 ABC transporter permease [Rhizobium leguminosarum]TBG93292.1 ABC transporter permease [Rhizobium leguminosarum]TBG98694.1 ABC transporter permease [Rhizobium leguminosarum]TBH29907.1 ABC transporter permease [Rhizobium leguminosarum]TBH50137.1 ABC transporter permease [Rhizobium leguminosarum]
MRLLISRILSTVPVLFGLCVLSYTLLAMIPGDPVTAMLGMDASPDAVAALRAKFALDEPLPIRFLSWFGHLMLGDLGRSIQSGRPVLNMVMTALVPTIQLGFAALLISLLIAIPAGVISASRRNTAADYGVSLLSLAGLSLPSFWLAILLVLFLSIRLQLFPSSGYVPFSEDPISALRHITLPAITLGVAMSASTMRMTRAAMLEVLNADYIRTARAKGLPWRRVVWKHALRNALIPVTTLVGLQLGQLMGGVVVTETVFAWPGIGKLTVDAIFSRDYPVVQGAILASAVLFVFINLATDLLYAVLDPRLRKRI